ncbi:MULTISPECIES: MBL fold metallo-hydrolase [Flavobacteriaceae]|uniref:MBL fold metallo-hydrolase n=1 Tax=Flavobacteriaceae TaxID=49546 RepID=UPI0023497F6E|nr:MBL fold metallo-hydrolase [Muricauda sp. SP22]MDC6363384.1 MBL fold metallo-hydrolase [Muricauda sp. SP22]
MKAYHLNCTKIESPFGSAIGHCILIENHGNLTLIDAGIGLAETREPEKKLGRELVEITGFQFDESFTAIRQIEELGLDPLKVTNIICSHLDPDHIGGIADFSNAKVHVSKEEYDSYKSGNERYFPHQLSHNPEIRMYSDDDSEWLGLPARRLDLALEAYLIPLFGHTLGHCGVAYRLDDRWTFYVGDAYYLKAELQDRNHPVDQLATIRAVNNEIRLKSLDTVRMIIEDHGSDLDYFGYHDPTEFKEERPVTNNSYK